jgi:hypothetical protein
MLDPKVATAEYNYRSKGEMEANTRRQQDFEDSHRGWTREPTYR